MSLASLLTAGFALWIFIATIKIDVKKRTLLTTLIRRRGLAQLKLQVKLERSRKFIDKLIAQIEPSNHPIYPFLLEDIPSRPGHRQTY